MSGGEPPAGRSVWQRIEAVPRLATGRDASVPAIIAVSLVVHASVVAGLYFSQSFDIQLPPHEIPVEIVQLPPAPKPEAAKPPEQPRPAAPKPPPKVESKTASKIQLAPKPQSAPKPPPVKTAQKPPPKPAAAKPPLPPPQPVRSVAERMKDLLGPIPGLAAVALPGTAEAGTESVSYSQLVMSKIAKAKKEGRYPGVPGYATVAFSIGDDGKVASLDLRRPSGDPSLDTEAVELVKRAEPYPPPPPG